MEPGAYNVSQISSASATRPAWSGWWSIVLLPGSVIWAAAQVRAFGQVMDENSGMGLKSAILLAAVLVAAYSVVGGLLADAVTDVIQGIAVLAGLIILGAIVAGHVGGVSAGLAQVEPQRLKVFDAQGEPCSARSRRLRSRFAAPSLPSS